MPLLLRDKIAWVKGLVMDCPFGEPQPDCPLNEIRLKPVIERFAIIDKMSDDAINSIIIHHKQCLERREGR